MLGWYLLLLQVDQHCVAALLQPPLALKWSPRSLRAVTVPSITPVRRTPDLDPQSLAAMLEDAAIHARR